MGRGQQEGRLWYVGDRKGEAGSRKWVLTLGGRTPKQSIQFSTGPRIRESLRIISYTTYICTSWFCWCFWFQGFWKGENAGSARLALLLHFG